MIRRLAPWLGVIGVAFVLAGGLAWVGGRLLDNERAERVASAGTLRRERLQRAVWRAEALIAPVLAEEAARPHFHYQPFYSPARAYTRLWEEIDRQEVFVPSPIQTPPTPWVRLHFQLTRKGQWSSPQAPTGNMLDLALASGLDGARVEQVQARLAELARGDLGKRLWAAVGQARAARGGQFLVSLVSLPTRAVSDASAANGGNASWNARRRGYDNQLRLQNRMYNNDAQQAAPAQAVTLRRSGLVPVWWEGERCDLLLVRLVDIGQRTLLQGLIIDWTHLDGLVQREVADIFPAARLVPRRRADPAVHPTSLDGALTELPAELSPGTRPPSAPTGWTPLRIGLGVAWGCLGLGLGGVVIALRGLLRLNRRRLEFVSAVTHELRTPLTTFQMYTEMLNDGVVSDPAKRQRYIATLHEESLRLSHLVQNVLGYSRLEARRWQPERTRTRLGDLLERVDRPLTDRCSRGGMTLETTCEADREAVVDTDPAAVEQILFNLVDNACKYAKGSAPAQVELAVSVARGRLRFTVRDHGPGLSNGETSRLFAAFARGTSDATQPGIGLGLALARRWARQLDGDLVAEAGPGGRFTLSLPLGA